MRALSIQCMLYIPFTQLGSSTMTAGDPQSKQMFSAMGPQRMATMLSRLGLQGAVSSVNTLGPANAAAVTIMGLGPEHGAEMFRGMGATFSAGRVVQQPWIGCL